MVDVPDDEYEQRVARARLARREARQTIDEQIDTLSDIDEKAIQLFRINLVVASILVTGLSIAVSAENVSVTGLITPYTVVGSSLLFSGIVLSSVTYTSTSGRIGIAKGAIREGILNREYDYDLVEAELALQYGQMIRYNYKKNVSNALLFTLALVVAVGAICYITIGIVDVYSADSIHLSVNVVMLGFFLLFGKISGLYGTTCRWWRLTNPHVRLRAWARAWRDRTVNSVTGSKDS